MILAKKAANTHGSNWTDGFLELSWKEHPTPLLWMDGRVFACPFLWIVVYRIL
jgi:hypothetical protein